MKSYFLIYFVFLSCFSCKLESSKNTFYIPKEVEFYRQVENTSDLYLDSNKLNLFIPIDVSCSSCLGKFSNIAQLEKIFKSQEYNLQIVPICISKDNNFEIFKYWTETNQIDKIESLIMLDIKGEFYKSNEYIKFDESVLVDTKGEILLQGKFADDMSEVENLKKELIRYNLKYENND